MIRFDPLASVAGLRRPFVVSGLAAALLAIAGCAAPRDPAPASAPTTHLISKGEGLARENCGDCHAIGETGASPLADAPPLRTLRARYSRDQLAALLATRMVEVHPRMPRLKLDEDQVDALLDYLHPPS